MPSATPGGCRRMLASCRGSCLTAGAACMPMRSCRLSWPSSSWTSMCSLRTCSATHSLPVRVSLEVVSQRDGSSGRPVRNARSGQGETCSVLRSGRGFGARWFSAADWAARVRASVAPGTPGAGRCYDLVGDVARGSGSGRGGLGAFWSAGVRWAMSWPSRPSRMAWRPNSKLCSGAAPYPAAALSRRARSRGTARRPTASRPGRVEGRPPGRVPPAAR
jgi:hypothetical protein